MEYQDYKYIMSDMSKVYIGTKLTYKEVCDHDYSPFKFVVIINQYLYKDVTPDMTLEEHLLSLTKESISYMTFTNLKVKVKMNILSQVTDKKGNVKEKWLVDQILPIEQYVNEETYHLYPEHAVVTELIISKLHLMAFSI